MSRRRVGVDRGIDAKEGKAGVALTLHSDTFEMTEHLRKLKSAAVFSDNEGARRNEGSGAKKCEDAAVFVGGSIGRVKENDVERRAGGRVFRGEALQATEGIEFEDSRTAADAEGIEIFLNERSGRRMIFDEHGFGGAAAERFDANGAGPREEIEEAATRDAFGENIKK
jgi:hypothetical protein